MARKLKIVCWICLICLILPPVFYPEISSEAKVKTSTGSKRKTAGIKYNPLLWYADNSSGEYVAFTDSIYISQMSDQEKAAVAFSSIFYDNHCDSPQSSTKSRCSMIEALGLDEQCSKRNLEFLKHWFFYDKKSSEALQGCQIVPPTATFQERFVDVSSAVIGELYLVKFTVAGMDLREMKTWSWKQVDRYILKKGRMVKLDSTISYRKEKNIEEPDNKE